MNDKPALWRVAAWNLGWWLPVAPVRLRRWLYDRIKGNEDERETGLR